MRSTSEASSIDPDGRVRDALTELHTYALILDAERRQIEDRIAEPDDDRAHVTKLRELRGRQAEIDAQLTLLDRAIRAVRATSDPTARYL